jgi:hypothetical protein
MREREREKSTRYNVYIPTSEPYSDDNVRTYWARGRRRHDAFIAGKHHIFVLPGKSGELEPECLAELLLHPVGHTDAVAVLRRGGALQVFDPVGRPRVHQEVEGVHPLGPGLGGCAVEHVDARVERDRVHVGAELPEERAEPEQVLLPARGPLGAHHHVPARQQRRHVTPVLLPVPRQRRRADRRDLLRYRAQAVRHRRHRLAQRRRHHDRVKERAVVAHVQAPASTSATARLGRVAGDEAVVHAGERADGEADAVGEEGEGDGAEDDERDAEREEGVHGERGGRRRREREAAVVEDEGTRVLVARQRSPSPGVGLAHSESFLQGQRACTLYVGIIVRKVMQGAGSVPSRGSAPRVS